MICAAENHERKHTPICPTVSSDPKLQAMQMPIYHINATLVLQNAQCTLFFGFTISFFVASGLGGALTDNSCFGSSFVTSSPSSLSRSSLIEPISGLGTLQLCGRLALKLLVCPLTLPLLEGVNLTVALPLFAVNSGIAIPSPANLSSVRCSCRDLRPSVWRSVNSFKLSGIAKPYSTSSSSSSGSSGRGERWIAEGEISRTAGAFEEDSMPAERSSRSSSSRSSSSGEVRKKEKGFSSIAEISSAVASSSRMRSIVGGQESRRWSSLKGIARHFRLSRLRVVVEETGDRSGSRPVYVPVVCEVNLIVNKVW